MVCQAKIEMSYVLILYALLSFLVVSGKKLWWAVRPSFANA
jgi:hypothetical protein